MTIAIILSALLFVAILSAHYEVVRRTVRHGQGSGVVRFAFLCAVLLSLHLGEVLVLAGGFELGRAIGLGDFKKPEEAGFMDVYYFALATYSTLGLGKVMPQARLAFVAGVGSFCGFLAISMSASALFQAIKPGD